MKQKIYQFIYHRDVNFVLRNINKFLTRILPGALKIPPSGVITIKNEDGQSLKIKTNQTSYVTQLLFWNGYEAFEYTDIFIELAKKIDVFYDIGANIGYYSLLAKMENPEIKVVSFEPASGPLFYFKENIKLNNFSNIEAVDLALSEKSGEITFYEIQNKKYSYLKHNLAGEGNAGSKTSHRNFVPVKVKTETLDQYVSAENEQNIDLIKMDTEGTEHLILNHSKYVLDHMKPIVICETLYNTIESELETIFKKRGYEFYNHTDAGLEKVDSIIRAEDDGVRNCFFVHPSKFELIEEFIR